MGKEIANNLPVFNNSISDYDRAYQALVRDFSEVVSQITALNAMWTGQAHDALMERFRVDQNDTQAMLDYLRELLDDLRYAHQEYTRCENAVAGIIDAIRV